MSRPDDQAFLGNVHEGELALKEDHSLPRGIVLCSMIAFSVIAIGRTTEAAERTTAETRGSARPDGVRLTTTWPTPIIRQGETIVNTIDVYNAVAGHKIRIQNSNHGASYFTTSFSAAVQAAVSAIPGLSQTPINTQQMEITLTAGTYKIDIDQTVTMQGIPGNIDDAPWAPGTQLQTDWILASAPSNGAPVENGFAVDSKWITYTNQAASPGANNQGASSDASQGPVPEEKRESAVSDARWSLLRSAPSIGTGGVVTFEIHKTNYALTSPTTLHIAVDSASTATDADFTQGLDASVSAALNRNVTYDTHTGTLTFSEKAVFPFVFSMTAASVSSNKDYVLAISNSHVGAIDVARAGVRLGTLSIPPTKPLLGLNEASGEFGVGSHNFKYTYPGKDRLAWAAAQGFGIIRVPFIFQNVQASSSAPLNEAAMRPLDSVMNECAIQRLVCLLDLHNYGSYFSDASAASQGLPGTVGVSNARLANFWAQIASRYKDNPSVWFDLMNEPNKQSALEWVKTSNAIAAAIRATGATNKIVFQGTAWDGAWTWSRSGNAMHILKAYDPRNNFAFEAHQYLDGDGSGTSPNCVLGSGAERLDQFTTWLQKNGLHGILGEVGWAANDACTVEARALLDDWRSAAASATAGGYIGLTYWAAGPWWPNDYMYLAEPRPFPTGADPAQLETLKKYLPTRK
ncbi:glycoside hydrolase family 5 protein [Bradyrhizobium sp. 76]|uniref:glycoside hydrolase family 5 protein n=1 Tax=Bradyrhizobium sp. 76 TaxID=2782680 RepID=UPI001FF72491|nr:glycoside hydrolase family 5 protein [Bradyrhizobium sp. 76]MCK1404928.1 glycoside hydrolase family 5 protein [Bradyrhizobium sp. 76]